MSLTLPDPRIIPPESVPALRWGIVGTGIAARFVHALHTHTGQRAVAVAARNVAKTQAFATEHGILTVHEDPSALIADPAVDVVYISTPHPLHHDLALEAIQAGKHVLIEKPIAMSASETRSITKAGRAAGVLVMEAMWTRYLPQADIVRQILADGTIGEIQLVQADFGFAFPFDAGHRLWNADLGGGSLLDAGIYPISFASSVLGSPSTVKASGLLAPTGVDARADLLLTSASGATAMVSASIVSSMPVVASIMGTAGRVEVLSPFFGPSGVTLSTGSFGAEDSVTWRDDTFKTLHEGLGYQATAFASYVSEGRIESPLHPHEEMISIMSTIDEAKQQIAAISDVTDNAGRAPVVGGLRGRLDSPAARDRAAGSAIRHTVAFRLVHERGSAAEAEFLDSAAKALTAIDGVADFEVNRQVSVKSDLDWQLSMVFADREAYDAYNEHPVHVAFVESRWQAEVTAFQEYDFATR